MLSQLSGRRDSLRRVFVAGSEEMNRKRSPLGVQRAFENRSAGTMVPVARVGYVAFLAVQVGVHPRRIWSLHLLRDGMSTVPVAVSIMPESVQERRKTSGPCSGTFVKV